MTVSAAATFIAVGNTSFDDWPRLTSSLGCTRRPSPRAPPRISEARLASTSLTFMLVCVPEPVCQTASGNSPSCRPASASSAAATMASAVFAGSLASSTFTCADARLTISSARMSAGGIFSVEMRKNCERALRLRAPQVLVRHFDRSEGVALGAGGLSGHRSSGRFCVLYGRVSGRLSESLSGRVSQILPLYRQWSPRPESMRFAEGVGVGYFACFGRARSRRICPEASPIRRALSAIRKGITCHAGTTWGDSIMFGRHGARIAAVATVILWTFAEAAFAQQIEVLWLGHATFRITSTTGKVIVIDPFLKKNPRTPAKYKDLAALGKVDLILVTHGHPDHVERSSRAGEAHRCDRRRPPMSLVNNLVALGLLDGSKPIAMNKGGTVTPLGPGIKVHMVPAEHSSSVDLAVIKPETTGPRTIPRRRSGGRLCDRIRERIQDLSHR